MCDTVCRQFNLTDSAVRPNEWNYLLQSNVRKWKSKKHAEFETVFSEAIWTDPNCYTACTCLINIAKLIPVNKRLTIERPRIMRWLGGCIRTHLVIIITIITDYYALCISCDWRPSRWQLLFGNTIDYLTTLFNTRPYQYQSYDLLTHYRRMRNI